jgi:aquaporin NIP
MNIDLLKKCIAEAIGVAFLMIIGCGSIIIYKGNPGLPSLMIPLAFGTIICLMISAMAHISSAHFNPAVTLAFLAIKKIKILDSLFYIVAQFTGAMVGIFFLTLIFPGSPSYGNTIPAVTPLNAFFLEFFMTFVLMFVIMGVSSAHSQIPGGIGALMIGGTVFLDALWGGGMTGASMNPVRTLAPAIFEGNCSHVWLYITAPLSGAVSAAVLYDFLDLKKGELAVSGE